jgi:hypothetical protein
MPTNAVVRAEKVKEIRRTEEMRRDISSREKRYSAQCRFS